MKRRFVGALMILLLAVAIAGCGRGFTVEKQIQERTHEYVTALTERRLDDAKKLVVGGALQGAELSFPILKASNVQQKLISFEAKADPVQKNATRGFVNATYTVETDIKGYEKKSEVIVCAFDLIKVGAEWKISGLNIISTQKEGAN